MSSQRNKKQDSPADAWVSRSQRKRDSTALQKMAEELTRLAPGQWRKLPLTPELLEALHLWLRINDHEGRRRQLQYLGRLMRDVDGAAIASGLAALRGGRLSGHREESREETL